MTFGQPHATDDSSIGYITNVGVRREWRRRRIASALLQAAFAAFYAQGYRRVGLDVDATSLTNATRLYEQAGMRVVRQDDLYEQELRPGKALEAGAFT
jgi:ribosomal protein S18 acetylase RimI-like enzyme